jgi:FMN phosphatase YigB (HAD superfamily)
MAIRFVYFDLGNVLLHFSHRRACEQMGALSGHSADQIWEIVFKSDMQKQYEAGQITGEQFYETYCAAIGSRPDYRRLLAAASDIFTVNPAILPLLAQLKAGGHRLGILSNTCLAHWEHCVERRYNVISQIFDVYALSFQLQTSKPDTQIYLAAAELAGVMPQDVFFTDDLPENIEGAKKAGFDAVLFSTVPKLAAELSERGICCNY